jgi:response regulator RpfG family c-di-GMP phosphodiesterase
MLGLAHAGVWAATPNSTRLSAHDDKGFMSAVVGQDRLRVLVVDDEESIRTFAGRILRDAGYEVAVASDGPEALRLVDAAPRPFDLFMANC